MNSRKLQPRRTSSSASISYSCHSQPCRKIIVRHRSLCPDPHGNAVESRRRLGAQRGSRKVSQHRQLSLNAPTRGWVEALHSNALGFSLPRPKRLSNASLCHFAWRRLKCMAIHVSELKLGIGLALATPSRVPHPVAIRARRQRILRCRSFALQSHERWFDFCYRFALWALDCPSSRLSDGLIPFTHFANGKADLTLS